MFDMGGELNAETLTARLKESARRRRARGETSRPKLSQVASDGVRATNERASTESVSDAQAEFNQATIGALELASQYLEELSAAVAEHEDASAARREETASRTAKQFHYLLRLVVELRERVAAVEARCEKLEETFRLAQVSARDDERRRSMELAELRTSVLKLERALRDSTSASHAPSADASDEGKPRSTPPPATMDDERAAARMDDELADARMDDEPADAKGVRTGADVPKKAEGQAGKMEERAGKIGERAGKIFDYFMFEQRFRGSRAEIQRQQSIYLDLFLNRRRVFDLGCGRGEFVELLSERGVDVLGVDSQAEMVEFCRERGLRVVQEEIFAFLARLPHESAEGFFIAQVVEHLPPEKIVELLRLCASRLSRGGVLVAETINPQCPVALGNFYLDPSHVRPVPAELLRFICEESGLRVESLRFSAPVYQSGAAELLEVRGHLPSEINLYQDYSVVGVKPV